MSLSYAAIVLEVVLAAIGLLLLVRYVVAPRARLNAGPSPLPAWQGEPLEFLLFLGCVVFGTFAFAVVSGVLLKRVGISGDHATIVAGAAAQFGMLAGVLTFAATVPHFREHAKIGLGKILKSGAATFAISLPILEATSKGWELLLDHFGVPAEKQDLIRMFAEAKSPWFLGALIMLATVIAPVTEELVFRAGIYRFLRTRAPRFLALLVPAVIFASLHVNWSTLEGFASFAPLLVLAVLFSLAYERTGNIGTAIVAHALFNLNTIVLILCGLAGT